MNQKILQSLRLTQLPAFILLNLVLLCSCISNVNAQLTNDSIPKMPLNSVNIHLLGDGSFLSLTYERIFPINKITLSARAGVGYTREWQLCIYGPCNFSPAPLRSTFVHAITANLGGESVHFEIGIGGTMVFESEGNLYLPYLTGGVRWDTSAGNIPIVLRAFGNYGLFDGNKIIYIFFPLGLSCGFRF